VPSQFAGACTTVHVLTQTSVVANDDPLPPPAADSLNRCSNDIENMDNELDDLSFVIAFPLPFRVLFLAGVGILGWAANLHGLRLLGVDAANALDLRTIERTSSLPLVVDDSQRHALAQQGHGAIEQPSDTSHSHYFPVYRLAFWYGLWCSAAWAMYRSATDGRPVLVDFFKYVPAICALVVLIFMFIPYDVMHKRERDAFIMYALHFRTYLFFGHV
jgi:hypothetical protein